MSTASVSIDRTSLGDVPLVISNAGPTFRLTEEGIGRPGVTWRIKHMPNSDHIHGSEPIAAVKEQSSIPLEVMVSGASWAAVEASIAELDEALSQFAYTVTTTVEGVSQAWSASPADWSVSGRFTDAYRVAGCMEVLTVTIPVYPIAGV